MRQTNPPSNNYGNPDDCPLGEEDGDPIVLPYGSEPDNESQYQETDDVLTALEELKATGEYIDDDSAYQIVAALLNRQRRSPNPEYKPRWYKLIAGLTAGEEMKLYRDKKCYICRSGGHRLLACPKLRDGSYLKPDRINNLNTEIDGDEEHQLESTNRLGQ
jgi:hypothetical protein